MKIDIKDGARPIIPIIAFTVASVVTHGLIAPHVAFMSDAVVSDGVAAAAASGFSLAAFHRRKNDMYGLRRALAGTARTDQSFGAVSRPGAMQELKTQLDTELPAAIVAKYWILIGKTPDDESLKSILDRLQNIERREYGDNPRLAPEVALRIAGALTDVPDEDRQQLASRPVMRDWKAMKAALEQRMTEARFHEVMLLEKGRPAQKEARQYDVPSQDEVACYFILTGAVPAEGMRGTEVHRAVRKMQRHRSTPIDALAAKHAVLSLLGVAAGHPALLPPHSNSLPEVARFPSAYSHEEVKAAAIRYKMVVNLPVYVTDSFVGRDGWHYIRALGKGRKDDSIVATRGDMTSSLVGRPGEMDHMWDHLKAERCAKPMVLYGETETWTHVVRAQLVSLRRSANRMKDAPQMVWPSKHGEADPWADARQRLDQWRQKQLPAMPVPTKVHRVATKTHLAHQHSTMIV